MVGGVGIERDIRGGIFRVWGSEKGRYKFLKEEVIERVGFSGILVGNVPLYNLRRIGSLLELREVSVLSNLWKGTCGCLIGG